MQSRSHRELRKRVVKNYTLASAHKRKNQKVKQLTRIDVSLVLGIAMHSIKIRFRDNTTIKLKVHKIGESLILSRPRMHENTMEKLAVLDYLADIVFFNKYWVIHEDHEFYSYAKDIKKYKLSGDIDHEDHVIVSLATELFDDKDFEDYQVNIKSKVAKSYKFPTVRYGKG